MPFTFACIYVFTLIYPIGQGPRERLPPHVGNASQREALGSVVRSAEVLLDRANHRVHQILRGLGGKVDHRIIPTIKPHVQARREKRENEVDEAEEQDQG